MKNKRIVLFISIVCVMLTALVFLLSNSLKTEENINVILESSSYAYLPKSAKEYIIEYYEETGEILRTEKNKEKNVPYLNPVYINYLQMSAEEKSKEGDIPMPTVVDYIGGNRIEGAATIPSSYNLRNVSGNNYVTPVRDQGNFGLCWAFTTMATMESYVMKTNNTPYNAATTKLFNERQIDYLTSTAGINNFSNNPYAFWGTRSLGDGGHFWMATMPLATGVSVVDYDWKAYDDTDTSTMELYDVINYTNSNYEVNETITMPEIDFKTTNANDSLKKNYLDTIKSQIMENGAVYVGTFVNEHGIHEDSSGNLVIDVDVNAAAYGGGHAMTIIGWDDNYQYSYCNYNGYHYRSGLIANCPNVVTKKGAWILKNSWGTTVKPNGSKPYAYPYLTYDSLSSTYGFVTDANKTEDRVWDNSYLLADTFDSKVYTVVSDNLKDQNVVEEEKLELVKFITFTSDGTYTVTVTGPNGSTSSTVTKELPGLVTVDFSAKNFKINKNSTVTISGSGVYAYKIVSVFTSNLDEAQYIDLAKLNNGKIKTDLVRISSITKNIPSGTVLTYKFYDKAGVNVTSRLSLQHNVVADNRINLLVDGFADMDSGEYTLEVYNGATKLESIKLINFQMSGSGTSSDPYIINQPEHLNLIRNDLDGYYELSADIDMSEVTQKGGKYNNLPSNEYDNGHGWEPIIGFYGHFNGNGHAIRGLYQRTKITSKDGTKTNSVGSGYGGLFGTVNSGAVIKNVVLEDFDIVCHTRCGALVGSYKNNGTPTNEWDVEFSGIAVKNSKISGIGGINLGGVFGSLEGNDKSNLLLNNIYTDIDIENTSGVANFGMLAYKIDRFNEVKINNIQLLGILEGDTSNDSAIMVKELKSDTVKIENIFSTVQAENVDGLLCNGVEMTSYNGSTGSWTVKNVEIFNVENQYKLFGTSDTATRVSKVNVNVWNTVNNTTNLTNSSRYSGWSSFSSYWNLKSVDGVARYPVLKVAKFEYTKVNNISYKQTLNDFKYVYEYVTPNNEKSRRITFRSNDESILKIEHDGRFEPKKDGNTSINIQNPYYDGYNANVNIYVDYEPHYTIYFHANGGEGDAYFSQLDPSSYYTIPGSRFTKNYYEFKEWNTKADGTGINAVPGEVFRGEPDGSVVNLYAQWQGEQFTITFDPDGGVVSPTTKEVRYGGVYGELPVPEKANHGFISWVVSDPQGIGTRLVRSDTSVYYDNALRNLVAAWEEDAFTIVYYPNGGEGYSYYATIRYTDDGKIWNNSFEKDGYKFVGWNTEPDGSGVSYEPDDAIANGDFAEITLKLYAQWEMEDYELSFNSNGGVGTMDFQIFRGTETQQIAANTFTKEGHTFKEWNTKADGSGTAYANQAIASFTKDTTLYAIWNVNKVLITFNANDGSGRVVTQEVDWNTDSVLTRNSITRSGYDFVKWNTKADGSGTSYNNEGFIRIKTSLTLYAIWKESYSYKLNAYKESSNVIDDIPINTSWNTYRSKFTLNTGYTMEIVSLASNGNINTGSVTKIYKDGKLYKEFINVVRGDVNGDARITSADYIKIRKHIMKTEVISNSAYFSSADINLDGKVTSADYVRVRKIIMGG